MNDWDRIEGLRRSANLHNQSQNYQAAIEDYTRLFQLNPGVGKCDRPYLPQRAIALIFKALY